MPNNQMPYGLRDIKVATLDEATVVDVPAATTLSFKEVATNAQFKGDDVVKASTTVLESAEFTIEYGGLGFRAYSLMTGATISTSGVSPNTVETLTGKAGQRYPYFKVYGKAVGSDDKAQGDVHCVLYKCQLTSIEGGFSGGQFLVTKATGIAIGDDTNANSIYDWVSNETATDLPAETV